MSLQGTPTLVKVFLYGMIASVSLAAGIAVILFAFSDFKETETRILLTSGTVATGMLTGLACAALWPRVPLRWVAGLGLALTVATAVMLIHAIWSDSGYAHLHGSTYPYEELSVLCVWALTAAYACLLLLARLPWSYAWVQVLTLVGVVFLAVLLTLLIADVVQDSDAAGRLVGVLAVLIGAGTVAVVICHRLSRMARRVERCEMPDMPPTETAVLCPRCGARQMTPLGEIECGECGCRFAVTILTGPSAAEEPRGQTA